MDHFSSSRYFNLHDYWPSFGMLLFRSNDVSGAEGSVVDIIFHGVRYLESSFDLLNITIEEATPREVLRLAKRTHVEHIEGMQCYALCSESERYFIVCSGYLVEENNLSFFETSIGAIFTLPAHYQPLWRKVYT